MNREKKNTKRLLVWMGLVSAVALLIAFPAAAQDPDEDDTKVIEGAPAETKPAETQPAEKPVEPPPPPPQPVETPPPPPPPVVDEAAAAEAAALKEAMGEEGEVEEIVITGSMIRRKDLTTPAPVSVIDKATMEASGQTGIGEILQQLPAQSNAINIAVNNGGDGSTRINLRGIGEQRTLVLLNGRRYVYGGLGADASVDLNLMPEAVIERIEVLKDGASAIYGSDAIGGVVNIITRDNFEGVEANAYLGTTPHGDGTIYDLSVTAGHKFEKGSMLFSAGMFEVLPVWAGERAFSRFDRYIYNDDWAPMTAADCPGKLDGSICVIKGGSYGTPEGTAIDLGEGNGNAAWQHRLKMYEVDNFGVWSGARGWSPFQETGTSDVGEGDLYNYQPENYLLTPSQRYNIFASGKYRLHENVRAFFEATLVNRYSDQLLAPEPLNPYSEDIVVSADNYYNPFGRDFGYLNRRMLEAGGRNFIQDLDTFRAVLGLDGTLPEMGPLQNWYWDAHYHYGRTAGTNTNRGNLYRTRIANALGPSYVDENGIPQCGSPANPIPGCVPMNMFGGAGSITQEMLDYIGYTGTARGFNEMEGARLNLSGELFKIPFGEMVAVAFGFEYREESGGYMPNPLEAKGDTTGNKSEPVQGQFFVTEAYGELSIPLLSRMPGVEMLELSTAIRYADYSLFGGKSAWKIGARWQVLPDLAVRGTFSTAFRAPAITQLYSGEYDDFPEIQDVCGLPETRETNPNIEANCSADGIPSSFEDHQNQQKAKGGGNIDLKPETASILTAGVVFQPTFLKGFSTTLDFWMFSIDKSIQRIGSDIIMNLCYGVDPAERNMEYCGKIHRDPSHFIIYIDDRYTNIGGVDTWGIDAQIKYELATSAGRFLMNVEGTYTGQYDEIQPGGKAVSGLGVYDLDLVMPHLKFNTGVIWGFEGIGAGVNARYVGDFKECEANNCRDQVPVDETTTRAPFERDVGAYVTFDMYVSYDLKTTYGTSRFMLGVNNLMDAQPRTIYNGFTAASDPSAYDFIGRYMYVRMAQTF